MRFLGIRIALVKTFNQERSVAVLEGCNIMRSKFRYLTHISKLACSCKRGRICKKCECLINSLSI